ncbi:hypothetical protein NG798_12555 [Ancylothrix sp. C2]|nr:hypothetical protein [Ancylothrix sp. D3o]
MKNQVAKILLTLPFILILVASETATLTQSLKLAKSESNIKSPYTQAQVSLKPQLVGWSYYVRRKGRTEECTWLGINCN